MKAMLLLCLALSITIAACKSSDTKPDPIDPVIVVPSPTPVVTPSPTPAPTPVPVVKGQIHIYGDFSPACPGIPGFVAPKQNDVCDMGYRECSGGAVYLCEAVGMKSMSTVKCVEIRGVTYCRNAKK